MPWGSAARPPSRRRLNRLEVSAQHLGVISDQGVDIREALNLAGVGEAAPGGGDHQLPLGAELGQTLPEIGDDLAGRPEVHRLAACRQDQDLVRPIDVVLIVGHHHHRAARVPRTRPVSQSRQQLHHVTIQLGIQAGGRLIEE